MIESPETAQTVVAVIVSALSQIGIPGVFLYAWYYERRSHERTLAAYQRDLRRCAGLVIPEDVVSPGVGD